MPRNIIKHASRSSIELGQEKRHQLESWLTREITDALSSRKPLEAQWRDDLRDYEGVPEHSVLNFPIPNAPNIVITVGAIIADTVFAQAVDLMFGITPFLTCRGIPKMERDTLTNARAKAMQRFANWIVDNELDTRTFVEEMTLDNVQLGTGVLYIPFVERRKKTSVASIITRKADVISMPPEDVIVSGGSLGNIDELSLLGLRFWLTENELNERAKVSGWDITRFQKAGAKDWVRYRREALGKQLTGVERKGDLYDIFDTYCYYDIDGDGIDEDLYVVYSHAGQSVGKVAYNPHDMRPIEKCTYQRRAHLFNGLGVMAMIRPYQNELTKLHNYQVLNALLANCRAWAGQESSFTDTSEIWPGRVLPLRDPKNDLVALQMADVYPSMLQIQFAVMQLAERRVGVNEMSMPNKGAVFGNRTPGVTAMSLLNQYNKRFAPAFDGMRTCVARSVKQCLYRYRERLLAGNTYIEDYIYSTLGLEDGRHVVDTLRDGDFNRHMVLELTATSATSNREMDKQNAMLLVNIMTQYYTQIVQMLTVAVNPQTPGPVKDAIAQIIQGANELMDRTIRTFDQVRDPKLFLVDVAEGDIYQAEMGLQQQMQSILGQLGIGGEGLPALEAGGMM